MAFSPISPALRPLAPALCVVLTLGCSDKSRVPVPPDTDAPTAAHAPSDEKAEPSALDFEGMFEDLAYLSSDDLGGRYSLSDDLGRAARHLALRLESAGLRPVGDAFLHPFPYETGVAATADAAVVVGKRGRLDAGTRVDADRFRPLPAGRPGKARGEVVFVGYGLTARTKDGDGAATATAYDDFAGVDLEGKIALVLLHAPRTPDTRAVFERLERIAEAFDRDAGPARKAKDREAMAALHRKAREQIAALVEPFVGRKALPDDFTQPPEDPMGDLDMMAILGPVFRAWQERGGPKFDRQALSTAAKLQALAERGAVGAIFVQGPASYVDAQARDRAALPDPKDMRPPRDPAPIPAVQIGWKEADRLFRVRGKKLSDLQARIDTRLVPASAPTRYETEIVSDFTKLSTPMPNVLAFVPGRERPDEIVVVGAHYDHIGRADGGMCNPIREDDGSRDTVCNGADDNASGTAMVLALARSYASARPKRSVVFAFFAGEELGLHGSRALADHPPKAPPFEDGKVVAMINLDMVGRLGPKGLAIGGVGSSPAWMPLLDRLGNRGMKILYERAVASRSDQANFYRHEIPVLFFFTGIHRDYHRAGDEFDGINRDGMMRIGALVADTVWAVADGLDVPFSPPANPDEGLVSGLPGSNPATVEKKVRSDGTAY